MQLFRLFFANRLLFPPREHREKSERRATRNRALAAKKTVETYDAKKN